jgi:hypothetical protein
MAFDIDIIQDGITQLGEQDFTRIRKETLKTPGVMVDVQGDLSTSLQVTQETIPSLSSVLVGAGTCMVYGTDNETMYLVSNDAPVSVPVEAVTHLVTESRIDLVVVDTTVSPTDRATKSVRTVTGTKAITGSQVAPATPAGCLLLAEILITGNPATITNSMITDLRQAVSSSTQTDITGWRDMVAQFTGASLQWTVRRASDTSIETVNNINLTQSLQGGDRVRIFQDGIFKYFVCTGVSYGASKTTITLSGTSTVTTSRITRWSVSKIQTPKNHTFTYNPFFNSGTGWNTIPYVAVYDNVASIAFSQVNLTSEIQVGDKMAWTQPTNGTRYGIVTTINYNSTVPNATYIQLSGFVSTALFLNEAITNVRFSKLLMPQGYPDYTRYSVYAYRSGGQSIPNATDTTIIYNVADYDYNANLNTGTGVYTAPVSGLYAISGNARYAGAILTRNYLFSSINNALTSISWDSYTAQNTPTAQQFTSNVQLKIGDTFQIKTQQQSGGAVNIEGSRRDTYLSINFIKHLYIP